MEKDLQNKAMQFAKKHQVNWELTLEILNRFNQGKISDIMSDELENSYHFPRIDAYSNIISLKQEQFSFDYKRVEKNISQLDPSICLSDYGIQKQGKFVIESKQLTILGLYLMPYLAFGILNGGSASSYFDHKKNETWNACYYQLCQEAFQSMKNQFAHLPKALIPAYLHWKQNKSYEYGLSFLELKLRSLHLIYQQREHYFAPPKNPIHWFELISPNTQKPIHDFYQRINNQAQQADFLHGLSPIQTQINYLSPFSAVQDSLMVYDTAPVGQRQLFYYQSQQDPQFLTMPGGHGQNFYYLKKIYQQLYQQGYRFFSLGNIDNISYIPRPETLALLALTGQSAGFDFSDKTEMDVKGGVLVEKDQHLNCLDLGVGISYERLKQAGANQAILFNCAVGIFNLEYVNENIDSIIDQLPIHFSTQNKDIGQYSQAEQITWEILSLLKDPLIFRVEKVKHFLASKIILENFIQSGLYLDSHDFPSSLNTIAGLVHQGYQTIMNNFYRL